MATVSSTHFLYTLSRQRQTNMVLYYKTQEIYTEIKYKKSRDIKQNYHNY